MLKNKSGFTIVELLIVIVVIAILAAITIVAYNGIQARARDNIRYADAKAIMKALELYKADNGNYPSTSITTAASIPSGSTGCSANGYSFSWGTDGNWMKSLVDGGYLKKVPVPPDNGCAHYYKYLKGTKTSYGCTTRTTDWYMLEIVGTDGVLTPSDETLNNGNYSWKACPESSPTWGGGQFNWVFAKDDA